MRRSVRAFLLFFLCLNCFAHAGDKDWIETTGDVLQVALPLTALTATFSMDDSTGRNQLLLSFGSTIATTYALKYSVAKERPDGSNNLSFPSGHTSSAFSGASFMAKRFGWDVGVPAYLTASFVGYSRVHAEKHDWIDVTAGAAIAIAFNELWVRSGDDVSVAVWPTNQGAQFLVSARF